MKKIEMGIIGWREWVSLPKLDIPKIKAKVDTGARSSSLHAYDLKIHKKMGKEYASFTVHPEQRSIKKTIKCHAQVLEYRKVKSSNGQSELRPVIVTPIELLGQKWDIEITLTNRDKMGFRMLLGRESFRNLFCVDAGSSYYGTRLTKKTMVENRNRKETKKLKKTRNRKKS